MSAMYITMEDLNSSCKWNAYLHWKIWF